MNSKFEHALEEEDPEVIKELIMLIKKVGGLDELEKQLQMRLNSNQNSGVGASGKTTTTTISPISQSLYNKVLGTKRGSLRTQKVISSTQRNDEIEPIVQRQNKENRYSSVNRNSRPRPQNDGIDELPEVEGGGVVREKPQYTTITRTQAPKPQKANEDSDNDRTGVTAASVDDDDDDSEESGPTTHQPTFQYVNIHRARPSSTAAPADEDQDDESEDEDEEEVAAKVVPTTTSKMHYVNIQRIRPTKPQYLADEVESESPAPETK